MIKSFIKKLQGRFDVIFKTDRELSAKLYNGKFFYEIVKIPKCEEYPLGKLELLGPFENIRYLSDMTGFAQVFDGQISVTYAHDEILVTDRRL
jgi:hypothetical protein